MGSKSLLVISKDSFVTWFNLSRITSLLRLEDVLMEEVSWLLDVGSSQRLSLQRGYLLGTKYVIFQTTILLVSCLRRLRWFNLGGNRHIIIFIFSAKTFKSIPNDLIFLLQVAPLQIQQLQPQQQRLLVYLLLQTPRHWPVRASTLYPLLEMEIV